MRSGAVKRIIVLTLLVLCFFCLRLYMMSGLDNAWRGPETSCFPLPADADSEQIKAFVTKDKNKDKDAIVRVFRLSPKSVFLDRDLQFHGLLYDVSFPNQQLRVKVYDSTWIRVPVYGGFLASHLVGTDLVSEKGTSGNGIFDGYDKVYFSDKRGHVLQVWANGVIIPEGQGLFHFNGAFGCIYGRHRDYIKSHRKEYSAKAKELFSVCVSLDK